MKKISKICIALLAVVSLVFTLTGCDKNGIKSATVSGIALTIVKGEELDTSNAVVTATYKNDAKKDFSGEELEFGEFDSSKIGEVELSIKIVPEKYTFKVKINVLATESDVLSIIQLESALLTEYNSNRTNTAEKENFVHDDEPIYVGNDNTFHFRIKAAGVDPEGNLIENIADVSTVVKVEERLGNAWQLLEGDSLDEVVEIDYVSAKLNFKTADNEERTFRISVKAANADEGYEEANYSFTAEVVVVDGFNVYDTIDLSVYDNFNSSDERNPYAFHYGHEFYNPGAMYNDGGWKTFHDKVMERYDMTYDDLLAVRRVIFQADISVEYGNVRSDFFWKEGDTNLSVYEALTNLDVVGTPHNYSRYALFHRVIMNGESFSVVGNYFSINASKLPRMVTCDRDTTRKEYVDYKENEKGEDIIGKGMTAYSSLFMTAPLTEFGACEGSMVEYKNIVYIGNGEMTADVRASGSILLMKHMDINFRGYNTIANNFYMTYYFDYGNPLNPHDGHYVIEDCSAFDSFSSLIYMFSAEQTDIINCTLKRSGGPAILAEAHKTAYYGTVCIDEQYRMENGVQVLLAPQINIIGSTIESHLSGTEGWFNLYPGSGALIAGTAMWGDALTGKNGFSALAPFGYTSTGKTVVSGTADNGAVKLVNVQCALFGSGIAANRDPIAGTVNVFKTYDEYQRHYGLGEYEGNAQPQTVSLDVEKEFMKNHVDAAKLPIFECTETGAYRSTLEGAPTNPSVEIKLNDAPGWTGDHVNVYLPQSKGYMGLLIGLYDDVA